MVNTFDLKLKKIISVHLNRKLFSIWFISLVCIALGVVTTPYLSVVSFLLFFAALLFLQTEEIFALLFGLLPFANIFKLSTTSISLFTICEIGAVIYLLLKKRLKASQFMLLIALIAYLIISSPSNLNLFTVVKVAAGFLLSGAAIAGSAVRRRYSRPRFKNGKREKLPGSCSPRQLFVVYERLDHKTSFLFSRSP